MCYNSSYFWMMLDLYKEFGGSTYTQDVIQEMIEKYEFGYTPHYHISGFAHPSVPVITNEDPDIIQLFSWGLIPSWIKDDISAAKLSNNTLNARGETIFEKPSFRSAAKSKRCLILVNGFFEHHHVGKLKIPYYIKLKSGKPFALAGLWESWTHNGVTKHTCSIVTTKANPMMEKIHNNPNMEDGPRMPVILPKELEREWLIPMNDNTDKKRLEELIKPYPEEELEAYTVRPILGKNASPNDPTAIERFDYNELS